MHTELQKIAEIRSGYTFRGRIEEDAQGDVRVIQIKDIKGRSRVPAGELPMARWPGAGSPPLLQSGDLVLPARGDYQHAAVVEGGPVVASNQLFVVHTTSRAVTPEFLGWYLNQPAAQSYFRASRAGSNIPMLGKQVLGALRVPLPPLETQQRVVALHRLWERERELTERLLHNREKLFAAIYQTLLEQ